MLFLKDPLKSKPTVHRRFRTIILIFNCEFILEVSGLLFLIDSIFPDAPQKKTHSSLLLPAFLLVLL